MIDWHAFLASPAALALGGVWAVLALASLAVSALSKAPFWASPSELCARTRSWWWMVGLLSVALAFGDRASQAFLAFVSFLAFKEFLSIVPSRRADRRAQFWAYLAIPAQYALAAIAWFGLFIILIPVWVFMVIPIRMVLAGKTEGFLRSASILHWGLMLTVFSVSHLAFLFSLTPEIPYSGAALLLLFLFLAQFNDVAQYAWGKAFGKRKISPSISPKKTWEGFLGGLATTTALGFLLAPWLSGFLAWQGAAVGFMIAFLGFFGDLTMSAIKRDLGLKDSGSMIPGHGGILDRVDSLIFSAPAFFHLYYWLFF